VKIQALTSLLEKCKKSGQGYRARCPVHGSKGSTLSVTEKSGGYIVAHCFSCGADGLALCNTLGLPVSLLFPEGSEYEHPVISKSMEKSNAVDAIMVANKTKDNTLEAHRAQKKAVERLKGFEIKDSAAGTFRPSIDHQALKDFRPDYEEALNLSPALRSQIVEAHWGSVVERAENDERNRAENQAIKTSKNTGKSAIKCVDEWLQNL